MKLLSCADKLANIRDIIRDYDRLGDGVWDIFNASKGLDCMVLQFMQGKGFEPRTPTRIGLEPIAIDTKSIICAPINTLSTSHLQYPHVQTPPSAQASKWILIPKLILKTPASKPPSVNMIRLFSQNTFYRT